MKLIIHMNLNFQTLFLEQFENLTEPTCDSNLQSAGKFSYKGERNKQKPQNNNRTIVPALLSNVHVAVKATK